MHTELPDALLDFRDAQGIFLLAAQNRNQAEMSKAARLVTTALDQLARAEQQHRSGD